MRNLEPQQPDGSLNAEAVKRFEDHLPLLERVVSQVLVASTGSVRDMVYLGAIVLMRAATEWTPEAGLSFKEYAEVSVTSELLHFVHYPVPVLQLPAQLAPYTARLNATAQALASALPPAPMALTTYPAMALRHPAMVPYGAPGGEFIGAPVAAHQAPSAAHIGQYVWKLFKKRAPLILGLVILTEVGIAAATITSPKSWVAATTINSGIGANDPLGGKGDWFTQGTIVANITEMLKSRTVLENTITSLGLETTPDRLAKHITVSRTGSSGLLKVEAEAESRDNAAELANTVVREFMRFYVSSQSHEARSNREFMNSQVRSAQDRLRKAEGKLKTFKGVNVPEQQADWPARVSELMAQRDETARNLAAAQAGLAVTSRELARIKNDPLLSQRILNNGAVTTSSDKLRELQMNLTDAKDIYGANSPVVKSLQNQIARAKSQLTTTSVEAFEQNPALADASAKLVALKAEVAMNAARLSSLNRSIATLQPKAQMASTNQVTYEQLQREVRIAETQYMDLQTKFGQASLVAQGASNLNITVVDPAIPPRLPESSKLALKLILGLVLSLGLGMFISYLMSFRDKPEEESAEAAKPTPKLLPGRAA
jgi:uncharacterized protein involved in exopolysaccharide biosynthesis